MKRLLTGLAALFCVGLFGADQDYKVYQIKLNGFESLVIRTTTTQDKVSSVIEGNLTMIARYLEEKGVKKIGRPFSRYFKFEPKEVQMEVGFPVFEKVAPQGELVLSPVPKGPHAVTVHIGPYSQIGAAYEFLHDWMEENKKVAAGAPFEMYLSDPAKTKAEELRTLVYYPYADKK